MTGQEIIDLAEKSGMTGLSLVDIGFLERFAALVAEREREACAKVCDDFEHPNWDFMEGATLCSADIRASGWKGSAE